MRGSDFVKLTDEQIRSMFPEPKCPKCKKPLHEKHRMKFKGKWIEVCGDCYFGEFDKEINKHPIHNPSHHPRIRACT